MHDGWDSNDGLGDCVDLDDYLRVLRKHWKVLIATTLAGAVLGGILSLVNRPGAVPSNDLPFASSVQVTLLSERGRQLLADQVAQRVFTTVITDLEIEGGDPEMSIVDYAQALMADDVVNAAAQVTEQNPLELGSRVEAAANAKTAKVSLTVSAASERAARKETEAIIAAFRSFLEQGDAMGASSQVLITVTSPNPNLETDAGYTESRMPTYAALATSEQVLSPVASEQGASEQHLQDALRVRIRPETNILALSVSASEQLPNAQAVLNAVALELRAEIQNIESSPVRFQDLGSSSGNGVVSVRTVDQQVDPAELAAPNGDAIAPEILTVLLTDLIAQNPGTLGGSLIPLTDALTEDHWQDGAATTGFGGSLPESSALEIRPLAEVAGAAETAWKPMSVLITGRGNSQAEADAIAATAATALQQRLGTASENQTWPLSAIPSPVVTTSGLVGVDASAAPTPTQDRTATNVILGLLIGLALGVGYAFLASSRDQTIYSPRRLIEATGEPAFGVIPTSESTDGWAAVTEHDHGGEGYRALRSNVMLGLNSAKIVCLVAPTHGTGTHTVGTNLAISLSQVGSRVCVVETALGNPRLAESLGISNTPGLAEVLSGDADLASAITAAPDVSIDVLPAGSTTHDAADALTGPSLRNALEQLRATYDAVIVLAAPAVEGSQASAVAPLSDATLIIIRVGSTTMTELEITARILLQVGTKIGGIVANDVPEDHSTQWRRYLPMSMPPSDSATN